MKKTIAIKGLPIKNHRWQWMAGAAAASVAAVTSAHAADVTVTLNTVYLASLGTSFNLNPDLLGDGVPIIDILNPTFGNSSAHETFAAFPRFGQNLAAGYVFAKVTHLESFIVINHSAGGKTTGFHFSHFTNSSINRAGVGVGAHKASSAAESTGHVTATIQGVIPINFSDPNVNGGATTLGELTVTASADSSGSDQIELDSFSYNTISASVPDQTSTLALLALGAGGVLALRQRRPAA